MRHHIPLIALIARHAAAKPLHWLEPRLASASAVPSASTGSTTNAASLSAKPAASSSSSTVTTLTTFTTRGHTLVELEATNDALILEDTTSSTTVTISDGAFTTFDHLRLSVDSTGSLIFLSSSTTTATSSSVGHSSSSSAQMSAQASNSALVQFSSEQVSSASVQIASTSLVDDQHLPASSGSAVAQGLVSSASSSHQAAQSQEEARSSGSASASGIGADTTTSGSSSLFASGSSIIQGAADTSSSSALPTRSSSASNSASTSGASFSTASLDVSSSNVSGSQASFQPSAGASSSSPSSANALASSTGPMSSSVSASGVAVPSISSPSATGSRLGNSSATTTFFSLAQNQIVTSAPSITAAPLSGCALGTVPATNITFFYLGFPSLVLSFSAGLNCSCASGTTATLNTTYGTLGQETLYCATTTGTAGAQTFTTAASALPGNANNPDWANVTCNTGSLTNAANNPWQQWNDSGASAAWNAVVTDFNNDNQGLNFSNFVANFFHARPNLNCDEVGNSNCDVTVNCGQWSSPNADVDSPAGYMIVNSMVNLHNFIDQFNTALGQAVAYVNGQTLAFVSEFSPITEIEEQLQQEKDGLAILSIVLGSALSIGFTVFLQKLPFFAANPNFYGVSGDITNAAVNGGITYALVQSAEPITTVEAQISQYISDVATRLGNATQFLASGIFDDPDTLGKLIQNGYLFTTQNEATEFSVSQAVAQALFANALPMTWSLGPSQAQIFIATSAGLTVDGAPPTCDNAAQVDPSGTYFFVDYFDMPNAGLNVNFWNETLFCDTSTNTPYWLISGYSSTICHGINARYGNCEETDQGIALQIPTGLASLNGTPTAYGGLNSQTVFDNAIMNWINAGNQNTNTTLSLQDIPAVQALETANVAAIPGLVQIPVCSLFEAGNIASSDPNNSGSSPYWPCPSGDSGSGTAQTG